MIKVDETILQKAELLAKVTIEPSEREKTMKEMEKLLQYAELLNQLDTAGTDPLVHHREGGNPFREDIVTGMDGRDDMLTNAPEHRKGQIVVPKTV